MKQLKNIDRMTTLTAFVDNVLSFNLLLYLFIIENTQKLQKEKCIQEILFK
jgi:hypothetical protein